MAEPKPPSITSLNQFLTVPLAKCTFGQLLWLSAMGRYCTAEYALWGQPVPVEVHNRVVNIQAAIQAKLS